jgi:cyanate permease
MSLGTGYLLSLVVGIGGGLLTDRVKNQRPLNFGASASLLLTGLNVLGITTFSPYFVVTPLSVGCLCVTVPLTLRFLVKRIHEVHHKFTNNKY